MTNRTNGIVRTADASQAGLKPRLYKSWMKNAGGLYEFVDENAGP